MGEEDGGAVLSVGAGAPAGGSAGDGAAFDDVLPQRRRGARRRVTTIWVGIWQKHSMVGTRWGRIGGRNKIKFLRRRQVLHSTSSNGTTLGKLYSHDITFKLAHYCREAWRAKAGEQT